MSAIGKPERVTQNRVIALFSDELKYRYLGDWSGRPNNSNIEDELLTDYLTKSGYTPEQINRAIYLLRIEATNRIAVSATTTRRFTASCHLGDFFSRFPREVKAAIPALVNLLGDTNENVRINASNALREIDPQTAAQFGIK